MNFFFEFKWGLGIGDWGLGIGDWAQSPIPNPHEIIIISFLSFFLLIHSINLNKK